MPKDKLGGNKKATAKDEYQEVEYLSKVYNEYTEEDFYKVRWLNSANGKKSTSLLPIECFDQESQEILKKESESKNKPNKSSKQAVKVAETNEKKPKSGQKESPTSNNLETFEPTSEKKAEAVQQAPIDPETLPKSSIGNITLQALIESEEDLPSKKQKSESKNSAFTDVIDLDEEKEPPKKTIKLSIPSQKKLQTSETLQTPSVEAKEEPPKIAKSFVKAILSSKSPQRPEEQKPIKDINNSRGIKRIRELYKRGDIEKDRPVKILGCYQNNGELKYAVLYRVNKGVCPNIQLVDHQKVMEKYPSLFFEFFTKNAKIKAL
ncbi:unnamed protein product [Blepharisma stoltei]|uniref:Chromo domain-containing protein n=1 Tax=Blepharisma stoltei TaxID=1481888 RepID=A0AAU9IXZ0_9CILI|nr:unnamed protein product [Blepharisma stoltei]